VLKSEVQNTPVFKVEAQHVMMFMFTESRVALLRVYMTVMCREVEQVQIEKGVGCGVVCSADRCGVGSVCVHGVAGDTSGTNGWR